MHCWGVRTYLQGVVFNEMKGAMSGADSQFGRVLGSKVYSTSTYHHNSGGDPVNIPDLSHEDLVRIHSPPLSFS